VKLLLDTHTAIWWASEHDKLPPKVKSMLRNDGHELCLSIASAWEIAIKSSIRKLFVDGGVRAFLAEMERAPIALLPITQRHLEMLETLPFIHRDPFDRLLVAVAKADGMAILTADENIRRYEVPFVWE
jgi:PIN domain nuclease of toxin-antitoxin system